MARTAFTIRESNDRDCRESGAAGYRAERGIDVAQFSGQSTLAVASDCGTVEW